MFISVIVPVYDDEFRLKNCLSALELQTYDEALYEVIVVDNNSSAPLDDVVLAFPHARLIVERKIGSYAARNSGIRISQGKALAFTDSDCIPSKVWLESGVKALTSIDNCGLVGGKVDLSFQDPINPTPVEIYDKKSAFPQKKYVMQNKFSVTANLFTFRSVFDSVGLFDEDLRSGGDQEWGKRVSQAGYKLIYSENAIVSHPARSSKLELKKKIIRQTSGLLDIDLLKKSQKEFSYTVYLNWLAYILPSPRITFSIIFDKDLGFLEKSHALGISLWVKWMRLEQIIRLKMNWQAKQYE